MQTGTFPDELKIARVIPLFKSGNRNLMSNYRPISILPTLSKIFEKLIHVRIYQFLDENQVLYNYQFGFRKAHSTVHAVQTAIHSVTKALDTSYQCMGIFIDFSKAFDTIKHNILLDKLYHYGVRASHIDYSVAILAIENSLCIMIMNVILLTRTSALEYRKGAFWALYFSFSMSMTLSVVQNHQLNFYCLLTIQTYSYKQQQQKNYTVKQTKYFVN